MSRARKLHAKLLLGTLALGLLTGCMQHSTSPVAPERASTTVSGRAPEPTGLLDTVGGVLGGALDGVMMLVVKTLHIVGDVGGSLSNGRWRLDVPAGAFDGAADISMSLLDRTGTRCELEITPAEKNNFDKPVRLTIDCSGVPVEQLKTFVIFRYDPAKNTWNPVAGSKVDLKRKTVSAPLYHFSTYAVARSDGKAGW